MLWGGRWQEGSACTTGEEVEQINAHMSRCGNTTKYMLPEGMILLTVLHELRYFFCIVLVSNNFQLTTVEKSYGINQCWRTNEG